MRRPRWGRNDGSAATEPSGGTAAAAPPRGRPPQPHRQAAAEAGVLRRRAFRLLSRHGTRRLDLPFCQARPVRCCQPPESIRLR
jgi:hypothetical protein